MERLKEAADPWRDYQKRRRWLWSAFFGLPVFIIIMLNFGIPIGYLMPGCALIWFAIVYWNGRFLCPRCKEPFHSGYWLNIHYSNPFSFKCVHCGLAKWAIPETENEKWL